MNIDHFMIQDNDQIDMQLITGGKEPAKTSRSSNDFSIQSSAEYLTELRSGWSSLPDSFEFRKNWASKENKKDKKNKGRKSKYDKFLDQIGGPWAEKYSATLVSASVVPNYFPTMRVFEYNITGALQSPANLRDHYEEEAMAHLNELERGGLSARSKKHKFIKPHPPSKSQPPGPAYSPQTFSWASYTQYFANLTRINAEFASPRKSKYAKFTYEVEYDTKNDTIFELEDLTVRSYLGLAARIGDFMPRKDDLLSTIMDDIEDNMSAAKKKKKKHKKNKEHKKHKKQKRINKTWFAFVNRAYVGTKDQEDIHDQFGSAVEE